MSLSQILEPGRWGSLLLPNRMFMAPMTTFFPRAESLAHFARCAAGGIGLVMTNALAASVAYDTTFATMALRADSDEYLPALSETAKIIHDNGSLAGCQLSVGNGRAGTGAPDGGPSWSASATPMFYAPGTRCRALSVEQIQDLVAACGAAARRVRSAGFDAVDIHANNGYLVDQFISPQWNQRTDEYGGDLDGRMRFARELVGAIKHDAGTDFPVSFRLSAHHRYPGGRTSESVAGIARALAEAGVDVIVVDSGCVESMDWMFPPSYLGDAPYLDDVREVRAAVSIPVATTGNLTAVIGERLLADGLVDFIGFGRPILADPDLPRKVASGAAASVRPCIRCNDMCVGNLLRETAIECSVNPELGHRDRMIVPTTTPRRVTVIGAGPAGLEAARVAALRGHDVTIYEKSDTVGGSLALAAHADFASGLGDLVQWWEHELATLGVQVVLSHEVQPEGDEVSQADAVVVAVGATTLLPSIDGIDGAHVLGIEDYQSGKPVGDTVVICGGSLAGVNAALELARNDKHVTIVEMRQTLAPDLLEVNRIALLRELTRAGVTQLTGAVVVGIEEHGVTVRLASQDDIVAANTIAAETTPADITISADTIIAAFGRKSNALLPNALSELGSALYPAGDCVQPGPVGSAIHSGYLTGLAIA